MSGEFDSQVLSEDLVYKDLPETPACVSKGDPEIHRSLQAGRSILKH